VRRILEQIRTWGRDPRYSKSLLASAGVHALILFGALLISMLFRGCVPPFMAPKGSGTPSVTKIRFVPKKPKKKKYILNPNSAIIFDQPELDDSKIQEEVDYESQDVYTADADAVHGKMGAGGGDEGGWPDGDEAGKIRFARLKYDCRGWDDGMSEDTGNADVNFLTFLRNLPSVSLKIANRGEAWTIGDYARLPKGRKPWFIYMTGSERFRMSKKDVQRLRDYINEGGMIFADSSSERWTRSFKAFCKYQLFPDKQLREIADDDPIFLRPYGFPNGAPPLFHHGGWKAMGIKQGDRWVVFFHPGDVNDAWKTPPQTEQYKRKAAFRLGVNIVWYAVTNYLEETRKYRK
jgi:hypothetical protein